MKYIRKFEEVEAVQFLWGVPGNEEEIKKFAKTSEVKACIEKHPGGRIWLEIKKNGGISEIENKDFLVWANGRLCAIKEADFLKDYQELKPPRLELIRDEKDVRFKKVNDNYFVDISQIQSFWCGARVTGLDILELAEFNFKNGKTESFVIGIGITEEAVNGFKKELL